MLASPVLRPPLNLLMHIKSRKFDVQKKIKIELWFEILVE